MKKQTKTLLELFAGSAEVCKSARQLGIQTTFAVDWKDFGTTDLVADVEFLKERDIPFVPDIVWASPDCTTYSIAAISTHRDGTAPKTDYAAKCDRVNQNFIRLINKWLKANPGLLFYIENPRGMLGKMPFMSKFDRHTVWYCQYGDERAKPTHIFTNDKLWTPRPQCKNGNRDCHHTPAPRGAKTGTQGRKGSFERSLIPAQLRRELLKSALSQ